MLNGFDLVEIGEVERDDGDCDCVFYNGVVEDLEFLFIVKWDMEFCVSVFD